MVVVVGGSWAINYIVMIELKLLWSTITQAPLLLYPKGKIPTILKLSIYHSICSSTTTSSSISSRLVYYFSCYYTTPLLLWIKSNNVSMVRLRYNLRFHSPLTFPEKKNRPSLFPFLVFLFIFSSRKKFSSANWIVHLRLLWTLHLCSYYESFLSL